MNPHVLNWLECLQKDADFFHENRNRCSSVQSDILLDILHKNRNSLYGSKYNFAGIKSFSDFVNEVPLVSYEEIEFYIDKIKNGCEEVLTHEEIIRFEKTSGSTGRNKYIPYTNSLILDFQKGVSAWMHSIHRNCPETFNKKFYLALSPRLMSSEDSSSSVKIGSGDDLAYFDQQTAMALYPCLSIPETQECLTHQDFFRQIFSSLMKEKLSLISCWSPSYLLQIDALMQEEYRAFGLAEKFVWKDIWPDLKLVSCWTDASSSLFIADLKARLGDGVEIQGKGLMSTESICSIPYIPELDPVLAYCSHFYEFQKSDGSVFQAHELEIGQQYSVIITTSGGLYRYKTEDVIEVSGFYESIPAFRFLGRDGCVSDLVGEKLSEAQVIQAFKKLALPPVCLIADKDRYILCAETPLENEICISLDKLLSENCYYEQARNLGQLKSISCKLVSREEFHNIQKFFKGDISSTHKFRSLIMYSEWKKILEESEK